MILSSDLFLSWCASSTLIPFLFSSISSLCCWGVVLGGGHSLFYPLPFFLYAFPRLCHLIVVSLRAASTCYPSFCCQLLAVLLGVVLGVGTASSTCYPSSVDCSFFSSDLCLSPCASLARDPSRSSSCRLLAMLLGVVFGVDTASSTR